MSEPLGAFLRLRIARADLVRWLDAPVSGAAGWTDWRDIGGSYHLARGVRTLASLSDAELRETVEECDGSWRGCATTREAIRAVLDRAEAPYLLHCSFDAAFSTFTAGSLTYGENLIRYIGFFALARSAAAFLDATGDGVAVVRDYIWGDEADRVTAAALRIGPGATSAFLDAAAREAAGAAFLPIAEDMLAIDCGSDMSAAPAPVDELDGLR